MTRERDQQTKVRSDIGRYGIVPEWLLDAGLSARAIHLFAILAAKYSDDGIAYPGRRRLRKDMGGVSLDTVDRAIGELIEKGAITVTGRQSDDGDPTSNEYTLHFVRGAQGLLGLPIGGRTDAATPGQGSGDGSRTDAATVAAPMRPYPESTYPEAPDPELSRAPARATGVEIPTRPQTQREIEREHNVFGKLAEEVWLEIAAKVGSMYTDRAALRMVHQHAIAALTFGTELQILEAMRRRVKRETTPRRISELTRLEVGQQRAEAHARGAREEHDEIIEGPRVAGVRHIGGGLARATQLAAGKMAAAS